MQLNEEGMSPKVFALLVVALVAVRVDAFCWEPGKNPSFDSSPKVEQLSISRVRVSWDGIVSKRECADEFLVKYWQRNWPANFKLSNLVGPEVNHIDVDVVPKVPFIYQAVAREDKGPIRGVDWNKSPQVTFQTSSYNEEVEEPPPPPNMEYAADDERVFTTSPPRTRGDPRRENEDAVFAGLTVELLALIVIGAFIVCLVVFGLIYKCFRRKSVQSEDTEEDPEELEDVDRTSEKDPSERTAFKTAKADEY